MILIRLHMFVDEQGWGSLTVAPIAVIPYSSSACIWGVYCKTKLPVLQLLQLQRGSLDLQSGDTHHHQSAQSSSLCPLSLSLCLSLSDTPTITLSVS